MIADAFDRLFRTYERADRGTPEELARDRLEKAEVYFEAVSLYEAQDVLEAVRNFISGSAPGHNPSFVPPAPLVGAETRRVMNLRLEHERRMTKPSLPPPRIEHTAESRARVLAMGQRLVDETAERLRMDKVASSDIAKDLQRRTDARFAPDMDEYAIKRRLRIDVGDAEGNYDAGEVA